MAKKETTPTTEQIAAVLNALSAEEVAKLNAGALTIADILKAHPGLATKLVNAAPSEDDKDAEIASLKAQLKAAKKGKAKDDDDEDDDDDESEDVELPIVIKTKSAGIDWSDKAVDLGVVTLGAALGVGTVLLIAKAFSD